MAALDTANADYHHSRRHLPSYTVALPACRAARPLLDKPRPTRTPSQSGSLFVDTATLHLHLRPKVLVIEPALPGGAAGASGMADFGRHRPLDELLAQLL